MKLPRHRVLLRAAINRLLIARSNIDVAAKKLDEVGMHDQAKVLRDISSQLNSIKDTAKYNPDIKSQDSPIESPTETPHLKKALFS